MEDPVRVHLICPVCEWEDDYVQYGNPDYEGGANKVSLHQAQMNYAKFGAAQPQSFQYVRSPLPDEIPGCCLSMKPPFF